MSKQTKKAVKIHLHRTATHYACGMRCSARQLAALFTSTILDYPRSEVCPACRKIAAQRQLAKNVVLVTSAKGGKKR